MENTHGRFLVVDDEAIVRHAYGRVLTEAGYEVEAVDSGRSAIEALRANHYDGLFADLKMPDMDGIEVTRLAHETRPEVPVVIITGYPSSDTAREAVELGALMYQSKPVAPDKLVDIAKTTLEVSRARGLEIPAVSEQAVVEAPPEAKAAPTEPGAAAEPIEEEPEKISALRGLAKLATAPIVGGAFVLFMPFIAFFVLAGLGLKSLGLKVGLLGEEG